MRYSYVPASDAAHAAYDPFKVTREPFPAPVRTSREPWQELPPQPVLKLAEFARELGWEVRTQYSQGRFPHATTGKPSALKEAYAVRFGGHPLTQRQAYAVHSRNASGGTWVWSSVMIWGPDLPPYAGCGIEHLRTYLLDAPTSLAEVMRVWVKGIKELRAEQDAAAKQRAKERPKKANSKEGLQ